MKNKKNKKKTYKNKNKVNNEILKNQDNKANNKPWLIMIMSAMIIVIIVTIIMALSSSDKSNDAATTGPTDNTGLTQSASSDEPPSQTDTSFPTQTESPAAEIADQPQELTDLLLATQKSYGELSALGCSQLVTVDANYTEAQIRFWEQTDGKWTEATDLSCYGFVGVMGTVDNMSEDISGTPRGLHPIGSAFYRYVAPDTGLGMFQITEDTYWVDDPDSKYYNQRVEGTEDKDWNSAEHMSEYSVYNYGFVVNYNMNPTVYNAGSAIFFHIGSSPTAGCIATSEDMVKAYLSALNIGSNPYILVN